MFLGVEQKKERSRSVMATNGLRGQATGESQRKHGLGQSSEAGYLDQIRGVYVAQMYFFLIDTQAFPIITHINLTEALK